MLKIGYISNLDLSVSSGGWSGINKNIYEQLSQYFDVKYLGPINPPFRLFEKYLAKFKRIFGFKSDFTFFSEKRLTDIGYLYNGFNNTEVDAYFFLGNTPWIKIKPDKPYYVYLDADFTTYLKVFSKFSSFSKKSINTISTQEALWLKRSKAIFFGSNWIMNETINNLKLPKVSSSYFVINTGGHMISPLMDQYIYSADTLNLLFVSLNFEKKGGFQAVDIFLELKNTFSKISLTIIGEKPPSHIMNIQGVTYLGKLSKDNPWDLRVMETTFAKSSFLIHPTKMDTMGAIIPEANYFGTPVIASDRFGIPDLVLDSITGLLIKKEDSIMNISMKIQTLYKSDKCYLEMRKKCREFSLTHFTWDAIGSKIFNIISSNERTID